ncbi:sigma 54-interacting transcriptional regulator [candidate division KSB1 bacterium]|nr:sigma 54-interacting transcriptional regulator [candidate division KSB1 bacterium]
MKNILLSFVGNHDPFDPVDNSDGPILNLLSHKSFEKIYLFYNSDIYLRQASELNVELKKRDVDTYLSYVPIEITDPTDYSLLFPLINDACQKILTENSHQNSYYFIAMASGTPQMHTIWVLLQQSQLFPAKLLQALEPKFRKTGLAYREITFEIDNFPKIISPDEIKRLLNISELKRERLEAERKSLTRDFGFSEIIGESELLRREIEKAVSIADSDVPVLICGETGTGKELFARAIHFNSQRKEHPFICVNCAALPEHLIESELFGHKKGAFTGAIQDKKGKFQLADEGTIFLDEIGDMPLSTQAKILRALQEKEISPVGSEKTIKLDVRVISATNMNLEHARQEKRFRDDLYYRIKGLALEIPPLRKRKQDIIILANHILQNKARLTSDAQKFLYNYSWPGNVRELKQSLHTANALSQGNEITKEILMDLLQEQLVGYPGGIKFELPAGEFDLKETLEHIEKDMILNALKEERNNQTRAAKRLGMTRQNFNKKLLKYNIAT